ncbi:hypothetical protein SKAU_G00401300 [Synaphobranchus kaupii]|uniref:Uncharacterized protein n=1 Tax=Synaphobranchus kaupii TaxID=118154 RepID=A0A9Q1E959_SYNKA|nr:hypothetical protein SKAU_G00401300 [Synaphobranchus kaupii]
MSQQQGLKTRSAAPEPGDRASSATARGADYRHNRDSSRLAIAALTSSNAGYLGNRGQKWDILNVVMVIACQ